MKSLETLLIKPSVVVPKWIVSTLIGVSFVGFLNATYLTAKHYLGTPLPCSLLEGCEQVTNSRYSVVFGIPVALGGVFYYLLIFILLIIYLDIRRDKVLFLTSLFTVVGLLASMWFVYLQFFVIKALCLYCMVSAVISTILFILGVIILSYFQKGRKMRSDKTKTLWSK